MAFLKTKFYPVNIDQRIIYNTPKNREKDCSFPNGSTTFSGCIGIKGAELNAHKCYDSFTVQTA